MIIAVTYTSEQVAQVEKLIEFIRFLKGKKKGYAIVLSGTDDTHDEFRTKLRLTAEVAFLEVDMVYANAGNVFGALVERMAIYKEPWIRLDPFSVPLVPHWLDAIRDAYDNQPRKILGPHLTDGTKTWLAGTSVYPPDLINFPKTDWTPISTKTQIIQIGKYEKRTNDPAFLFVGDKTGEVMESIRVENKK